MIGDGRSGARGARRGADAAELAAALERAFPPEAYRAVLSEPAEGAEHRRATLSKLDRGGYLLERFTETQAFHETLDREAAVRYLSGALGDRFFSFRAWDVRAEYALRVSRKGRVLTSRALSKTPPKPSPEHDREKRRLLPEGVAVPALIDAGIFTRDGAVVHSMRGKFRQVNRFLEIFADEADSLPADRPPRIVDFGCGKAYLTFALYHYLTEVRGREVEMTGLDLKRGVVERCGEAAARYGYSGLRFEVGDIGGYECDTPPDAVISLHACDVATDRALARAVALGAGLILCAPCCQHELNAQGFSEGLSILGRYGAVKERFCALATDAIRARLLDAAGYRAQIVEFVDSEHTPKNLMIRAVKRPSPPARRAEAMAEVMRLMDEFRFKPALFDLLSEIGALPRRPAARGDGRDIDDEA